MDFDDSFDEPDDSEDYDEFLFESIQRYNTLQMFNLENIPYHLVQIDETSLCVASKRKKGENSELLKLKLPGKLTLPPEEEGRSKENDFKVLSGIYTDDLVYQIDRLESSCKIITSEKNTHGLQVYSFMDSSLGNKNQEEKLDITPWTGTNFAIIQETTNMICSKCCHKPIIQGDVSTGEKVREIEHPFLTLNILPQNWTAKVDPCCINNVKCKALTTDLVAVLNTHSGDIVMHDLRTKDSFVSLPGISQKQSKEEWTFSGCDYRETSLDYFGTLSNRGSFCIYDKRKNSILVEKAGVSEPKENNNSMKMKFDNRNARFSVSGMDSFVRIYRINGQDCENVFTHNGHCPSNLPSVLTTDHIWLQTGGNEYIVSVCDNCTLNCWDYKI